MLRICRKPLSTVPNAQPQRTFVAALILSFIMACPFVAVAQSAATPTRPTLQKSAPKQLKVLPKTLVRPTQSAEQTDMQDEASQAGGTGLFVMDNVDFHPIGGGQVAGLSWNAKVPVSGYYEYADNSYVIVSGTVHGDGLISGPGKDDWTFVVNFNTADIIGPRPAGCSFSAQNRPQTASPGNGWKYQLMIVFLDTATKPECFEYFQSLGSKPFPVKMVDIVGPYWTGDKQYQESKTRYYKTGPMLPLDADPSSGHTAEPWEGPLP